MIEEAGLVLAMTPQHAATVRLGGETRREASSLAGVRNRCCGRRDPGPLRTHHGRSLEHLRQLHEHVERVADRLEAP